MNQVIEELVRDGFTERMAKRWKELCRREEEGGLFETDFLSWAHSKGFLGETASTYGLTDSNLDLYLSDYDYYRLWPLNPWQRIWINDKLTLKYILDGTLYGKYMPQYYYYYSREDGSLLPLMDISSREVRLGGLSGLLEEVGAVACKPCNGQRSEGFHKLAFGDDGFTIDGCISTAGEVDSFGCAHGNYVFTEYLTPERSIAPIDPLIHTLRLVTVNVGAGPVLIAGYLRFGLKSLGSCNFGNYTILSSGEDRMYFADIDLETGAFGGGRLVYANRLEESPCHPDSGVLVEGTIPGWSEILDLVYGIAERFSALRYIGFDIGVTDNGPRIMEINSHPGVHYMQLFRPLMRIPAFLEFYKEISDAIKNSDSGHRRGISR